MGVESVLYGVDDLHSFGVVDFSASALVEVEQAESSVKGPAHELPSRGGEVDIGDCSDVALVDEFGPVHPSEVEGVAVRVVVAHSEVHRLERVETQAHGLVGKSDLLNCSLPPEVVNQDRPVRAGATEDVGVRGGVPHLENTVDVPLELLDGLAPLVGPHLNDLS